MRSSLGTPSKVGASSTLDAAVLINLKKQITDKDKLISTLEKQLEKAELTIQSLQENELKIKYQEKMAKIQLSSTQSAAKRTSIQLQQASQLVSKLSSTRDENRLRISQMERNELEAELDAADEFVQNLRDDHDRKISDLEAEHRESLAVMEFKLMADHEVKQEEDRHRHEEELAICRREAEGFRARYDAVQMGIDAAVSEKECEIMRLSGELDESRRYARALINNANNTDADMKEILQGKDMELARRVVETEEARRMRDELQERTDRLEGEVAALERRLAAAGPSLGAAEMQVQRMQREVELVTNELEVARRSSVSLRERISGLESDNLCLESRLREVVESSAPSQQRMSSLRAEIIEKDKQYSDLLMAKERVDRMLADSERSLIRANVDLEETRRSSLAMHERVVELGSETSAMQINLFETTEKLHEKERDLSRALEELEICRRDLRATQERVLELERNVERLSKSELELSTDRDTLRIELAKMKSDIEDMQLDHSSSISVYESKIESAKEEAGARVLELMAQIDGLNLQNRVIHEEKEALAAALSSKTSQLIDAQDESKRMTDYLVVEIEKFEVKEKRLQEVAEKLSAEKVEIEESLRNEMKTELDAVSESLAAIREEYEKKLAEVEASRLEEIEMIQNSVQELTNSEDEARNSLKNELDAVVELMQITKLEYEKKLAEVEASYAAELELLRPPPPAPEPEAIVKPARSPMRISNSVRLSPRFKYMSERDALIALFEAAEGMKWSRRDNWFSDKSIGEWYGVTVDEDNHVVKLDLRTNNLTGTLPFAIGNFLYCKELYLNGNYLKGTIPDAVGYLPALEVLNLTDNAFTGNIPDLSGAINLKHLLLSRNSLTGSIPLSIERIASLEILALRVNKLSSSIPNIFGSLTMLRELRLNDNQFTGSIPPSLCSLSYLELLDISNNQLAGSIDGMVFMSKSNLKELNLSNNKLSGSLPSTFYSATSLEVVNLQENKFSGAVEASIFSLERLVMLNLSQNDFHGSIPDSVRDLSHLKELNLNINKFTGKIPREIGKCVSLQKLVLSGNQLMGTIPDSITALHNLKALFLSKNQLSGSIPANIGNLYNLEHLHLNSNLLTGPLPDSIGGMDNLRQLFVNDNKLSGGSFGSMLFGLSKSKVQVVLPKCVINV